ncbi:ScbR family autoregulator-binding transcription factor [Kitasatospora sp. DSM 101779]|uniref:ScbR family autoregulator-binding transcription factor n=1 Tax=Kitasatospora sp. DSM 101779 TaxID=2853165 RepID=UPI0021D8B00B|nr:ScbR family autoregulator-binding transcription factor [Kitasatospora sp. DSM 101779]MCU7823754.1 TetR/AcrR family transcriptional regulator [Kitasatospora sp. DSM 101779]
MAASGNPVSGTSRSRGTAAGRSAPALKQARALRTRATVLEAAAALFARKGFKVVTMQEIAEEAGATKGAVYFHFPNKEALAAELVGNFYAAAPKTTSALADPDLKPLETVRRLTMETARRLRDDAVAQAAVRLQTERLVIDADLPLPFIDYIAVYTLLLERAKEAGELPADVSADSLARTIVASFFGVQHVSWILHDRADVVARVEELLDLILPPG